MTVEHYTNWSFIFCHLLLYNEGYWTYKTHEDKQCMPTLFGLGNIVGMYIGGRA